MEGNITISKWVYPLGTASEGGWDVSLGTADSSQPVEGWAQTGLKVATLKAGATIELPPDKEERLVVPLSRGFTVTVDGETFTLAGRQSVFSGPTDVLYSGTGRTVAIKSSDGGRIAIATAPSMSRYPTRLITLAETPVELRGQGTARAK